MIFKKLKIFLLILFVNHILIATQVQLITTHKKSNGTLLRIVTSSTVDIDNIAGWSGQENWFYVTLNGTYLSPKVMEYIEIVSPIEDIEITENNQSVQLGFLFNKPVEDYEIFHSSATRVLLIQVWESLNDSLRSQVKISEGKNINRVFSLPKQEAKGAPFYDSFVYARDKYGPEKYFVWYSNWYSTHDLIDDSEEENPINYNQGTFNSDPKPLIIKKQRVEVSGPPRPIRKLEKSSIDISFILNNGFLIAGSDNIRAVKALQEALVALGYDLGEGGMYNDGVDGEFGPKTEDAVIQFQLDRGFNSTNVDGIVGEGTYRELIRALQGEKPIIRKSANEEEKLITENKTLDVQQKFGSVLQQSRQTARELLNQAPITTQIKRETRKLPNTNEINLLPPDLSNRKTFLKLSCNLEGANVFIDGALIGTTPILKKFPVTPGWHRVRVVDPDSPPPKFAMEIPDYQDIYIPKGRTQKIRINLAQSNQE
tara:strand:- start:6157 stop:7608 length:1452 start_codon:yes stop_codon:yes gene_type:complete